MRSIGTLKIPEEDVQIFLEALEYYGFAKSGIFLRRAAMALVRQYKTREELAMPLAFKSLPQHRHKEDPPNHEKL